MLSEALIREAHGDAIAAAEVLTGAVQQGLVSATGRPAGLVTGSPEATSAARVLYRDLNRDCVRALRPKPPFGCQSTAETKTPSPTKDGHAGTGHEATGFAHLSLRNSKVESVPQRKKHLTV